MNEPSEFTKFIFKYLFIIDIGSLSKKEKIGIISIYVSLPTIMLLWAYMESHDWIALLLCDVYVFYLGLFYPLFFFMIILENDMIFVHQFILVLHINLLQKVYHVFLQALLWVY